MSHKINWYVLPSEPDTIYPPESAPPGSISILQNDDTYIDHTICDVVNGKWVINPVKKANKEKDEADERDRKAAQEAEKAARKERLGAIDWSKLKCDPDTKVVIKDLVAELEK